MNAPQLFTREQLQEHVQPAALIFKTVREGEPPEGFGQITPYTDSNGAIFCAWEGPEDGAVEMSRQAFNRVEIGLFTQLPYKLTLVCDDAQGAILMRVEAAKALCETLGIEWPANDDEFSETADGVRKEVEELIDREETTEDPTLKRVVKSMTERARQYQEDHDKHIPRYPFGKTPAMEASERLVASIRLRGVRPLPTEYAYKGNLLSFISDLLETAGYITSANGRTACFVAVGSGLNEHIVEIEISDVESQVLKEGKIIHRSKA